MHAPAPKQNLKGWWSHLTLIPKPKRTDGPYRAHDTADHPVFGKPLIESLHYASVQISTANASGDLYVWGYIPVVVAKCGLYLKENATEVPGTFRVNGSNKRMRDLQAMFESPPRYGKSLDWRQESYTTHDVASVFRRYLTQMPEPVIPYDMYHLFRDALSKEPFNQEQVISTYKALIRRMPPPNQYLLLYVLDLLSVFARKAEKNLMTATNLAVIFRPGFISHPLHEMSPQEHALSQKVLEFLIAQQDWFMLDISPPPNNGDRPQTPGASGSGSGSGGGGGGGGGPGGKWREGSNTPTRQGTGASFDPNPPPNSAPSASGSGSGGTQNQMQFAISPEAGPSNPKPNSPTPTTRQRSMSYSPPSPSGFVHQQQQYQNRALLENTASLPPSPTSSSGFAFGPAAGVQVHRQQIQIQIPAQKLAIHQHVRSASAAPQIPTTSGSGGNSSRMMMGYSAAASVPWAGGDPSGGVASATPIHTRFSHVQDYQSPPRHTPPPQSRHTPPPQSQLLPQTQSRSTPPPQSPPQTQYQSNRPPPKPYAYAQSFPPPALSTTPIQPSPSPLGSGCSDVDEFMVIPSSSDARAGFGMGGGGGGGGGGFLVLGKRDKEARRLEKMVRRRTAVDPRELLARNEARALHTGTPSASSAPSGATVVRSRTLPSSSSRRRGGVGAANPNPAGSQDDFGPGAAGKENLSANQPGKTGNGKVGKEKRVLKKLRRASAQTGYAGAKER